MRIRYRIVIAILIVSINVLQPISINVLTGGTLPGPLAVLAPFSLALLIVTLVGGLLVLVYDLPGKLDPQALFGAGRAQAPAVRSAELPDDIPEFTGRQTEIRQLDAFVHDPTTQVAGRPVIVNIYGRAGTGKSVLAIHFAHRMMSREYGDICLYVDLLSRGSSPLGEAEVLGRLVRHLGASGLNVPGDIEGLRDLYHSLLDGKRAIVLLDNVVSSSQVEWTESDRSAALVIITSRQALEAYPHSSQLYLDNMVEADAIQLLETLSQQSIQSEQERSAARNVCSQCGFLPLALSMAGAQLRQHPKRMVAHLADRLKAESTRLEQLDAGEAAVRASFSLSYVQLTSEERALWRRLPLLPEERFDAEVAATLIDCDEEKATTLLDRLVSMQVLEAFGARHYGFHDLVRLYAGEKLNEDETSQQREAALHRALASYQRRTLEYGALLDTSLSEIGAALPAEGVTLEQQIEALDWFERKRPALMRAIDSAVAMNVRDTRTSHALAWLIGTGLTPFFRLRGYLADWQKVQDVALPSSSAVDGLSAPAWTELYLGHLYLLVGRYEEAMDQAEVALESAEADRHRRLVGRAHYLFGRVNQMRGRLDEAVREYSDAIELFQGEQLLDEGSSAFFYLATALHEKGFLDTGEFQALAQSALAAIDVAPRRVWSFRTTGWICERLGLVAEQDDDLRSAGVWYLRSRDAFSAIGYRYGLGCALRNLGRVRAGQRNWRDAVRLATESATMFRVVGAQKDEGVALLAGGEAMINAGDKREGRDSVRQALTLLTQAGASEADRARSLLQAHR